MANEYLKGLAHIGVRTQDMQKSLDFYEKLGFTVDEQTALGETKLAFIHVGTCILELIQAKNASLGDPDGVVAHIAIECVNLPEYLKSLQDMGLVGEVNVSTNPNFLDGVRNCFFRGPSNENIELFDYYQRY